MPADSSTRSTVLIVDDTPENLTILGETLRPHYRVRAAISGERALHAVTIGTLPDVILLDVMMPDMDGYQVLQALKADAATRDIPVIFVTAMDSVEGETHGLALGAVDYITKPFNPDIVLARVRTHIELAKARERLHDENAWLEREVARRTNENALIRDLSLSALACLAEVRDIETGHHILRTQSFVELLAHHLAGHPDYREALAGERLEIIVRSAPLHDIGKVGIPDSILLKPGRLTSAEFEIMKKHPVIGADAITRAMAQAANSRSGDGALPGGAFAFMETAREIALSHHEKWDGSGYPAGLQGRQIPVSARLMALADVFDALSSRRVYKEPLAPEDVTRIIVAERGRHFDPVIVDAFLELRPAFAEVAQRFAEA
ncbi:two-component system response regulator [Thauera sp.]|uniref:response regulator n=1 Tax=Thauera sp. TaxID=1905334 RepID=UPI001A62BC0E|nr:two-component system response regulator [Thauera sp.]MBL8463216.1 two-component system response regulator [Thauera sp.]MBP6131664.1 two-component system response regulator [Thauera sp.]MBP7047172.1 two-component system response regulator [Thauera sp.]